jgi:hypothetical protein
MNGKPANNLEMSSLFINEYAVTALAVIPTYTQD